MPGIGGRVSSSRFMKSYEASAKARKRRLARLSESPGEQEVHGARTAVRRFQACAELLPGKMREGKRMETLLASDHELMRRTAEMRDLDIIGSKVSQAGAGSEALLEGVKRLRARSSGKVAEAVRAAVECRPPKLHRGEVARATLQRRFDKVVGRLSREVVGLLPVVVDSPEKRDELHRLRITGKKLRYVLELGLDESSPVLASLEGWQDALGEIHDWDVTLQYLRGVRSHGREELLRRGADERARLFRAFVRLSRSSPPFESSGRQPGRAARLLEK